MCDDMLTGSQSSASSVAHRVPGLPEVLVEAAKNWPATKASALYLLQLARKYPPDER